MRWFSGLACRVSVSLYSDSLISTLFFLISDSQRLPSNIPWEGESGAQYLVPKWQASATDLRILKHLCISLHLDPLGSKHYP